MKTIIFTAIVGIVIAAALSFTSSSPVSYVKEATEVVREVEVTPDWAQDEDAVKAAQAVIRKKELEAELKELDAQIKDLTDKRKAVTQELTAY